ncbi:MAG: two-component system sensor histidine kinase NtrB [Planctomycetota bacterium]|jgi:two-component system sensor kinase FixL
MTPQTDTAPDPPSLLMAELRWFVRLRWFAGLGVTAATLGNALAQGWTTGVHARFLIVGASILGYNLLFWPLIRKYPPQGARVPEAAWAWGQIVPDLAALTLLTIWTGGLASPLLLAFVLHMVLASLLLAPMAAYAAAATAMAMVFGGLWIVDQWPVDRHETLMAMGWMLTLLLTIFLTNHISHGMRVRATELRQQSRRTRGILETAPDGIITIDEEGVMRSVNPAAERLFGYNAAEMVGRSIGLLMPEPHRSEHKRYLADYLRTGRAKVIGIVREAVGRRKDGTVFPIDLSVGEVPLGTRRFFTGIVRDITDRKAAEAELKQLNEELLRQQQALIQHEKMAAMGQMAAGMAHEIANPLASMDSVLQLVTRHPERLGPTTIEALREQINRINDLLRRMRDFAHPGETAWEMVAVNDTVEGALEMIGFDQRTRRVQIARELAPDAGRAEIMPHAIQQVVINLVLNALDAVAGVPEPRITVATAPVDAGCVVKVTDNGRGIAPENLSRVFEPFFTTKPVGRGTGLGLSISYSLVEHNHGRLEVASRPGEGTTFSIHLPASRDREGPGRAVPSPESPHG